MSGRLPQVGDLIRRKISVGSFNGIGAGETTVIRRIDRANPCHFYVGGGGSGTTDMSNWTLEVAAEPDSNKAILVQDVNKGLAALKGLSEEYPSEFRDVLDEVREAVL